MEEISRDDIYTVTKSSNIDKTTLQTALKEKVYADKSNWSKFLKLLFLSLGAGFTVSGVIFFMAYNWQDLNKFIKLGLLELLIIIGVLFVLLSHSTILVKNITLTAVSLLVGALFAVFGQIYQTGANAYDFFLGWLIFISVWVFVANYAPLWLLFSGLINITFYFYSSQVAKEWPTLVLFLLFVLINGILLISFKSFSRRLNTPSWYTNTLTIVTCFLSTATIISIDSFTSETMIVLIGIIVITALYILGILESIKYKNIFNIALISLSIIICTIYYLFRGNNDDVNILLIALFSIVAFSLSVKLLLNLQKKWNRGKN